MFTPPSVIEGMILYFLSNIIILIIGVVIYAIFCYIKKPDFDIAITIGAIIILPLILISSVAGGYIWHETMEVPSVQTETITVHGWQPRPGAAHTTETGAMVIDNADQLLLQTDKGEYQNTEDFWFMKFNTRDIFNRLHINGTYKIKYYGWRNGFNHGFPNILSIEEVINENNTTTTNYYEYMGTRYTMNGATI